MAGSMPLVDFYPENACVVAYFEVCDTVTMHGVQRFVFSMFIPGSTDSQMYCGNLDKHRKCMSVQSGK